MRKAGTRVAVAEAPLTPEERRELVTRPFPAIRTLPSSRAWGGTSVTDWTNPDKPSRAYSGGSHEWLKHLAD